MVALSAIGLTYILVLIRPILWWRKQRELAIDVVVLIIITAVVMELLKLLFMRERTFEVLSEIHMLTWGLLTTASGFAMPCGHTARVFAMATLIALWIRSRVGVFVFYWPRSMASAGYT
jgi:membrane-associated phospholipid phosphatase